MHANFDTRDLHVIRELLEQGYSIIACDYRGSTGYGAAFYQNIDYGGREIDDVFNSTQWMLDTYSFLDPKRAGMMGWSHGGFITLMNIMEHPKTYAVAYAGVPVSDLVARMGYEPEAYRQLYSAQYHIGKTVREDIEEYRKRSPGRLQLAPRVRQRSRSGQLRAVFPAIGMEPRQPRTIPLRRRLSPF